MTPLILFPGMGADERMFKIIASGIPQMVIPAWIDPVRGETLNSYARRLAKVIDPGGPCFVGGASFGGAVALELATNLPGCRGCFLIGSVSSPAQMPLRLKMLRVLVPFIGLAPLMIRPLIKLIGRLLGRNAGLLVQQLADSDGRFLRWAARAILTWKPSPAVASVRIKHIHGEHDPVFPSRLTQADYIVRGAGHVPSLTHPHETVDFLTNGMADWLKSDGD